MSGAVGNKFYTDADSALLAGGTPPTLKLRLFTNNVTPTLSTVPGDLTECAITGYAAITLVSGSWTISGTAPVKATYPIQNFNLTASGTIYGYYVTDSAGTNFYWGEKGAGAPFTFGSSGGTMSITLELDGPSS
jgi:hypothetical protein